MTKFNKGDKVLFEGEVGIVVETDEWNGEREYAVKFSEKNVLENLFGCTDTSGIWLIESGYGSWIAEEELEAAE